MHLFVAYNGSFRLLVFLIALLVASSGTAAVDNAEGTNRIVRENALPGDPPSEWDIDGVGDPAIQGFSTDISVNRGEQVDFKIDTDAPEYIIEIYRIGYYGGMGARRVASLVQTGASAQPQPDCLTESDTGLVDCGNWRVSASWQVPAEATPGVHLAKLTRTDMNGASHILFVVRDDETRSDILVQTSDTTWQAYNYYGGYSLYVGPAPAGRAYKASYNRPLMLRGLMYGRTAFWVSEYPMIRWLEANGYDVSYSTGVDTARRGHLLKKSKVFMSIGHDEYWSDEQRSSVEAAREAGVHLAFFSGNAIFWKTRWEPSLDASGAPYRTMVCYKDTHAGRKIDPSTTSTGTWRDARFSPQTGNGRPENALKGSLFVANCCRFDSIVVSAEQGQHRFWRHTPLAKLDPGQAASVGRGTVGYEWDADVDNGYRPPGLMQLSATTVDIDSRLRDFGSWFGPGSATHSLTLFRHRSGALVFSAGTIHWGWALDSTHDDPDAQSAPVDVRLQQATVNLLADMSVRPGSPLDSVVVSDGSSDTVPPVAVIATPTLFEEFMFHRPVRIAGSATDEGGTVAAVEVSIDKGASWHPADGTGTWTYEFIPRTRGLVTILARAVDDSGHLQTVADEIIIEISGYYRLARAIALSLGVLGLAAAAALWMKRNQRPRQ